MQHKCHTIHKMNEEDPLNYYCILIKVTPSWLLVKEVIGLLFKGVISIRIAS